jgi:hypothetical protein
MAERRKSATRELVRLRTGRDDLEAHLRELYVDGRFTDQEIADAWGVARMTITGWRAEFGITRSDRPALLA